MTEYLKNPICNFTPLFNINYNKKTNIFSTCFFKMSGTGYKDFSNYVNGLIKLSQKINKFRLDYSIRLFVDNSIYTDKKIYNQIKNLKNVQIVLYTCPNYIVNDGYHIGLFGTMVRFFPFFDFPNNDAGIVVSADIDDTNFHIIKDYTFFSKIFNSGSKQIYLFKSGPLNRSLKYKFDVMYNGKFNPYVFALSYMSIKRINNTVLVNFFTQVQNSPDDLIYSYHHPLDVKKNIGIKEFESKYKGHEKYIYGIDEYFLNNTLAHYLIDNDLCYAVKTKWDIFGCLYYVLIESVLTPKELELVNLIFKYIYKKLNLTFDPAQTPVNNFNKLDSIVYSNNNNEQNKKNTYKINFLLYKLFLYFKTNKNYKFLFPNDYYKLWVDNEKYFGTYDIDLIKTTGCASTSTGTDVSVSVSGGANDFIIEYKKFTPDDIARLKKFYLSHNHKTKIVSKK